MAFSLPPSLAAVLEVVMLFILILIVKHLHLLSIVEEATVVFMGAGVMAASVTVGTLLEALALSVFCGALAGLSQATLLRGNIDAIYN